MRQAVLGLVVLSTASVASADIRRFEATVDGDAVACREVASGRLARKLQVEVAFKDDGRGRTFEVWSDRRPQPITLKKTGAGWSLETPVDKLTDAKGNDEEFHLASRIGADPVKECAKPFRPFKLPRSGPVSSGSGDGKALAEWIDLYASGTFVDHMSARGYRKDTTFLVHLPSGAPAGGFPESIPESAQIQVVAIVEEGNDPPGVEFTVCPDRELFRIRGGFGTAEEEAAATMLTGARFSAVPIGPLVRCGAGTMSYTLRYAASGEGEATEKATSVRMRPIHHLSASFLYGFDFVSVQTFEKQGGKIVALEDRAGPALRVGFTWHPFGLDLEDMRTHNRLLNPVVSFDPEAPTENFVVGNAFTWSGGISLIVGGSFRKSTVLNGMNPGDAIDDTAAIPTRKVWNADSRGWYFGFVVDQNVLRGIKGLVATIGK